jgi:hypothetical protein
MLSINFWLHFRISYYLSKGKIMGYSLRLIIYPTSFACAKEVARKAQAGQMAPPGRPPTPLYQD